MKYLAFAAALLLPTVALGQQSFQLDGPLVEGGLPLSGGTLTGDLTLNDDVSLEWGTSSDAVCQYDTAVTPDTLICGVGTDSRNWIFAETADLGTDWAKAQQTNPTVCVQSADETAVTDRICIAHDQTDAQITSDAGNIVLNSAGGAVSMSDEAITNVSDLDLDTLTPDGASWTGDDCASLTSAAANPASAGFLRAGNTECIGWRNAANGADESLCVDASDDLTWSDSIVATGVVTGQSGLDAGDANVTNVGNIDVDTVQADDGSSWAGSEISSLSSATANPAASGFTRLANTECHGWRNAANGADESICLDGSDDFTFSDNIKVTGTVYGSTGLDAGDAAITNVSDIDVDTVTPDGASWTGDDCASLTSAAANPADAGFLRAGNTECLAWRNAANGANELLCVDASDDLTWSDSVVATGVVTGQSGLDAGDNNITNVGNIDVDTVQADDGTSWAGSEISSLTSATANAASAGFTRLANTECHGWRNAANGADLSLCANASDQLTYAGAVVPDLTGTPANNYVGVFTDADTLEGSSTFTWNETTLSLPASTTETKYFELGTGRSGNGTSAIDLVGDATYTDFGLRILRANGGENTTSQIIHRGTGGFQFSAQESGAILFYSGSIAAANERLRLISTGFTVNENGEDLDTRFESDNNVNMLFVDGGADRVGIGDGTPDDTLDVVGNIMSEHGTKGALTTRTGAENSYECANVASYTFSSLIPDGAFLVGVSTRVTVALTGPTDIDVGDGVDVDLYADGTAVTLGSTTDNTDATANWSNPQLAAGDVVVTFNGGNCTAGTIYVVAHYFTVTAPSSN